MADIKRCRTSSVGRTMDCKGKVVGSVRGAGPILKDST